MRADDIRRELSAAFSKASGASVRRGGSFARIVLHKRIRWVSYVSVGALAALVIGALLVVSPLSRYLLTSGAGVGSNPSPAGLQSEPAATPDWSSPPFGCASEGMGSGTANPPVALIGTVSTASHPGYDRLIIGFTRGLPRGNIELRTQTGTKFTSLPSGKQLTLAGQNGILLIIDGADMHSSYRGPTEFVTTYSTLAEVRVVEDFNGVVQLGLGLKGPTCYRALLLNNPDRLVMDIRST